MVPPTFGEVLVEENVFLCVFFMVKIFLGTDHAGFALKDDIKSYLLELGCEVEDCGAYVLQPDDDYPDFILKVAQKVSECVDECFGIVFGGSGQGEALAANKTKGIRAALFYGGDLEIVKLSRQHNNANVLSLGARFLSTDEAKEAVKLWLDTEFEGGRHVSRLQKISDFEHSQ